MKGHLRPQAGARRRGLAASGFAGNAFGRRHTIVCLLMLNVTVDMIVLGDIGTFHRSTKEFTTGIWE
jgi:hypothetical protein